MSQKIKCPTCEKALIWSKDNSFRPFCSERCKLIDLGEWASESHKIPGNELDQFNSLEDADENKWDK